MSKYAVYELFNGCEAPENLVSCGHLAGVIVGKYDKNPLYMCPPSYMCPQIPDVIHQCRVQNERMVSDDD